MKTLLRVLLPVIVLALGVLGARTLLSMRPAAEHAPPKKHVPLVETAKAAAAPGPTIVRAQGTVRPRLTTRLTSEVAGRILEASPAWIAGGQFEEGELLLALDPTDARAALASAEQALAQAQSAWDQEEADARIARREWEMDHPGTEPSDLVAHGPQLRSAKAALDAAVTTRDRAERDLERCRIVAPFAGRVLSTAFQVGEWAAKGVELGSVFATDRFEVRLPLDDAELAFIDPTDAPVVLTASFAGREATWRGHLVRTEAELDPTTHMVIAVCEVRDPYTQAAVPLEAGTFVNASIEGRALPEVCAIPREALRSNDRVLVVVRDADRKRLEVRHVKVERSEPDRVLVSEGLQRGDEVVVSPIEGAVDGIEVAVVDAEGSAP